MNPKYQRVIDYLIIQSVSLDNYYKAEDHSGQNRLNHIAECHLLRYQCFIFFLPTFDLDTSTALQLKNIEVLSKIWNLPRF